MAEGRGTACAQPGRGPPTAADGAAAGAPALRLPGPRLRHQAGDPRAPARPLVSPPDPDPCSLVTSQVHGGGLLAPGGAGGQPRVPVPARAERHGGARHRDGHHHRHPHLLQLPGHPHLLHCEHVTNFQSGQ